MTYLLDTNIFLRTIVNDDEKSYKDCTDLLKRVKENKIKAVTSNVNIAEIAWTLKSYYKFTKSEIILVLNSINNLNGLYITNDCNIWLATQLYATYNVKFVDCILASNKEVQDKSMTIVSYDKDFDTLKVSRVEPIEAC